jgi:crossover junction endodeoxyribonuclease RuvC
MTFRVTLGVDPGMHGAIAVLADGEPQQFIDMPTVSRDVGTGNAVDAFALAALLRGVLQQHPGAHFHAALEYVNGRPPRGPDGTERTMGATSGARMAEGYGTVKGVLATLGIRWVLVFPQRWKAYHSLLKQEKDAARMLAIELAQRMAMQLARKKDCGRADALLIALWAHQTEAIAA